MICLPDYVHSICVSSLRKGESPFPLPSFPSCCHPDTCGVSVTVSSFLPLPCSSNPIARQREEESRCGRRGTEKKRGKDEKYMKLYLLCMNMQSPVWNSGEMYREIGERALEWLDWLKERNIPVVNSSLSYRKPVKHNTLLLLKVETSRHPLWLGGSPPCDSETTPPSENLPCVLKYTAFPSLAAESNKKVKKMGSCLKTYIILKNNALKPAKTCPPIMARKFYT